MVRFSENTTRLAKQVGLNAGLGHRLERQYRAVRNLCLVEVPQGEVEAALKIYNNDPNVLYAEPDYRVYLSTTPNDPDFDLLWGLRNTGQTVNGDPGIAGADIRAEQAWEIWTGDDSLRIAVVDTGINYNHPDLADNVWVNPGEIPGNGIDDDGNGWVDDIQGYDIINQDGDPIDDHGHGSHVAGTIGAVGNNGIGITGINWTCQLVAVKAFDAYGGAYTSEVIAGMDYVVDNRIMLSSHSWGSVSFSQGLYDVIAESLSYGHLFVVAAGNNWGRNIDLVQMYPAAFDLPNIISVAATDNDDLLANFSNIGPLSVDLGAPGVDIYSTVWESDYIYAFGTSMATPHVAGVAGLIMTRRPDFSWVEVKDRIMRTARPLASLQGRTLTGGILHAGAAVGDCNNNAIADEDDILSGLSADCNADEFPDECEVDCNDNGVPDDCDLASMSSADCNANRVPDECDLADWSSQDCNENAVPDECDLSGGTSADVNASGIPDECETCSADSDCDDDDVCTDDVCADSLCYLTYNTAPCDDQNVCTENDSCAGGVCEGTVIPGPDCAPIFTVKAAALNSIPLDGGVTDELTVSRGDRITMEIYIERWGPRVIRAYNTMIDPGGFVSGSTGRVGPPWGDLPSLRFIDQTRSDWMFFNRPTISVVWMDGPDYTQYGSIAVHADDCAHDGGMPVYLGTAMLDVSDTASGTFEICLSEDTLNRSYLIDCATHFQLGEFTFECLTINVPVDDCDGTPDCDDNGQWDICDIYYGLALDCNRNDTPDYCDISVGDSFDCNSNDVPDECDLSTGTSDDCNANAIPDDCEPAFDCNENGIQDICDLFAGTSFDCNANGIPDECDVFFVDADANGAEDGTSWVDAFTDLQDALAASHDVCGSDAEVWIATGTYIPAAAGGNRYATFQLVNGLAIYGGFAGDESRVDERDIMANRVVLSGDLNSDDLPHFSNRQDNVYHVVTSNDNDATAVLDGVIITGGYASGGGTDNHGGGLFNDYGFPTVRNCTFLDNYAVEDGGAMATLSLRPELSNCVFTGNHAEESGGALRHFAGTPVLTNCTLSGNSAGGGGGGIFSGDAAAASMRLAPVRVTLRNSILWGNSARGGLEVGERAQLDAGQADVHYSCIQGWTGIYGGVGNIGGDPRFVDADGPDDLVGTGDDNIRLGEGSSCVDAGDNDAPGLLSRDFEGEERVQGCRTDIGADESALFVDCNDNGAADTCEVLEDPTKDCNSNAILDACEEPDCNGNGIPDECDLTEGTSTDCDRNGIPDECDPDCDGDGMPDQCEILEGLSNDCNRNTVPDECDLAEGISEDCNGNATPDDCEVLRPFTVVSPPLSPIGYGVPQTHIFEDPPQAHNDVELFLLGRGDLSATTEYLDVYINDVIVGRVFQLDGADCPFVFDVGVLTLSADHYNERIGDEDAEIAIVASSAVEAEGCADETVMKIVIRYDASIKAVDCDGNETPDECEEDSDGDGRIDACDECPEDPLKLFAGVCGCGVSDEDLDGDGVPRCVDECPGIDDNMDNDGDGRGDCLDAIPAVSTWGIAAMTLLLLIGGKLSFRYRKSIPPHKP
ncbi:MAG: S8 family serine peptidase [Phycisphaerales bacterium]|nr:MAG: S8 family serine peptidase [Phycisphaerales bacterium]